MDDIHQELRGEFVRVARADSRSRRRFRLRRIAPAVAIAAIVLPAGWVAAQGDDGPTVDPKVEKIKALERGEIGTPVDTIPISECPGAAEKLASAGVRVGNGARMGSCEAADTIARAAAEARAKGVGLAEALGN